MDDFTKEVIEKLAQTGDQLLLSLSLGDLSEQAETKAAALSTAITHAKDYLASMS
jgi:hypothetical protein